MRIELIRLCIFLVYFFRGVPIDGQELAEV
jgi:hypothetical protein